MSGFLFRAQELAFRTQYAELKERSLQAHPLLPGTPGTLYLREKQGRAYWYRVYYSTPGQQAETLVGREDDADARALMAERIAFAQWAAAQVSSLRKLGFQVADKAVARVLVELCNRGAFEAGLVLVGTLAYMAWLNEYGAIAVAARTQDIDLARRQKLRLAAPLEFFATMQATGLPFVAVPGFPSLQASSAVKLPGVQGLRVDVLAPGQPLGRVIDLPDLAWAAQAVPYYDYLLENPEPAALLAGGQCIPLRLPQAARLVFHKLYSSTQRQGFPEKAKKDRLQAVTLAAVLCEEDSESLPAAFAAAPLAIRKAVASQADALRQALAAHPEAGAIFAACWEQGM